MRKDRLITIMILLFAMISCGPVCASSEGRVDRDFLVDVYIKEKAWNGNTILPDNHIRNKPRVVEINMKGEIVWEYKLPFSLRSYTNPGFDVERLPNDNILLVLPGKGIYEINREGKTVWSNKDKKCSHDADRLPNGNTIYVYGNEDTKSDAQVKEVNPSGKIVWSWFAKNEFDRSPYKDSYEQGWTHTNAVTRLENGNTLISPRNFHMLVEVDPSGKVIRTIGEGFLKHQHDPEVLPNGNILVANHHEPHEVLELDAKTGAIIWRYTIAKRKAWPVRDANRLPNGNTLITGTTVLLEVTPEKETVWRLLLKNITLNSPKEAPALGFYKAQRICN